MVITKEQIAQFKETGYVVLQNCISSNLLNDLRYLFDAAITDDQHKEKIKTTVNGKDYFTNIDNIIGLYNMACLEALGSTSINEIAQLICGDDYFMIQEFGVIKMLGDTTPVLWHQDMLHSGVVQCFTMGIYLDDADAENGALSFVPKSHLSGKDICEIQHEPSVTVPVQAGEILIHDMMVAHQSFPLKTNRIRRVLYFEFLNTQQVLQENIYDLETVTNRKKLLSLAKAYYQFKHEKTNDFDIEAMKVQLAEIESYQIAAKPSSYCLQFDNEQKAIFGLS